MYCSRGVSEGEWAAGASMDDIEWLRQILNNVEDGVYMVDNSRRIQFWNPAAKRITGFAAEEVVGHCYAGEYPDPRRSGGVLDVQGRLARWLRRSVTERRVRMWSSCTIRKASGCQWKWR